MQFTNTITVSVLMAVYNTPFKLLKRAIDSVLNQDFQCFELIILDDGSDYELSAKILHYCHLHPSKITYLRHHNCGQSESINRGVKMSNGRFIALIDADDEYKTHHLSGCLNEMPYSDLISSLTETIVDCEEDLYVPDKFDNRKNIHVDDCTLFATLFGKKEVFEKLPFNTMYSADGDFYERAGLLYRTQKVNLRSYIYYRNIANSICSKLKNEQISLAQNFN